MADYELLGTERLASFLASAVAAAAANFAATAAEAASCSTSLGPPLDAQQVAALASNAAAAAAANAKLLCAALPTRWQHQCASAHSFDTAAFFFVVNESIHNKV